MTKYTDYKGIKTIKISKEWVSDFRTYMDANHKEISAKIDWSQNCYKLSYFYTFLDPVLKFKEFEIFDELDTVLSGVLFFVYMIPINTTKEILVFYDQDFCEFIFTEVINNKCRLLSLCRLNMTGETSLRLDKKYNWSGSTKEVISYNNLVGKLPKMDETVASLFTPKIDFNLLKQLVNHFYDLRVPPKCIHEDDLRTPSTMSKYNYFVVLHEVLSSYQPNSSELIEILKHINRIDKEYLYYIVRCLREFPFLHNHKEELLLLLKGFVKDFGFLYHQKRFDENFEYDLAVVDLIIEFYSKEIPILEVCQEYGLIDSNIDFEGVEKIITYHFLRDYESNFEEYCNYDLQKILSYIDLHENLTVQEVRDNIKFIKDMDDLI